MGRLSTALPGLLATARARRLSQGGTHPYVFARYFSQNAEVKHEHTLTKVMSFARVSFANGENLSST